MMRNKLLIASFVGLVICFSCKKQTTDPVVPEQKVFENLTSCCSTCNAPVSRYNLTGKVVSYFSSSGRAIYLNITPDQDQRSSVPDSVLPLFKYYGGFLSICNMPDKIINSSRERRVKFDCKFFYFPIPTNTNGQIPQTDGYVTELMRIELID